MSVMIGDPDGRKVGSVVSGDEVGEVADGFFEGILLGWDVGIVVDVGAFVGVCEVATLGVFVGFEVCGEVLGRCDGEVGVGCKVGFVVTGAFVGFVEEVGDRLGFQEGI